jgi:hypothetical protein
MQSLNFKKNFFSILMLASTFLVGGKVEGQVVIFSENMGSPSGTTAIASNTFQNNSPIIFSGTADVRSTTGSTGYSGSSGNGNVFFTNSNKEFLISGINTSSYSSINLSIGILATVANTVLTVEYSIDGTNYIALTINSTISANTWSLKTATGSIPSSNNLRLKFSKTGTTTQFRLDDVKLTGTACTSGTWIGGATGNFNTASNWCGGVPASGSSLSIPVNTTVTMDGSNEIVLNNLTVDGTLILPTNAEVTVNGNITNNGQIILENKATIVQGASSTYAGSGTVQVKQAITGGNNGSSANGRFWYLGSPVAGGLSSILDAAGNNVVKYWDEPSAAWVEITDNTTALAVGKGHYLRSYTPGNQDLVFTGGLLNNGAYTFNVTANGSSFNGFNLVSNPYASYLKWDDVTKTNVGSTVWYRTSNGPNTMVFDTYNSNGNVGTSNNGNAAVSQYIPPMQAFWVKVEGSASGSIAMDNLDRSHHLSGNQGMYSMDTKLMFANLSLQNDTLKDQVIVYNSYEAADAMDAFDSEKMLQAGMPQIYSKIGDKKAVINAKLFMQRNEDTPLYMNIPTAGNFELKLGDFNSTFGSIWLEDKQTGVFQNLLLNDTYPFETQAGQDMARFVLHFGYPTQIFGSTEVSNGQVDNFENPIHWADVNINSIGNKQIELSASLTEEELNINKAIQIIDLTGRVVYEGKFSNGNSIYTVPNSNAIYLVKLNLGNQQKVYKLLVQD